MHVAPRSHHPKHSNQVVVPDPNPVVWQGPTSGPHGSQVPQTCLLDAKCCQVGTHEPWMFVVEPMGPISIGCVATALKCSHQGGPTGGSVAEPIRMGRACPLEHQQGEGLQASKFKDKLHRATNQNRGTRAGKNVAYRSQDHPFGRLLAFIAPRATGLCRLSPIGPARSHYITRVSCCTKGQMCQQSFLDTAVCILQVYNAIAPTGGLGKGAKGAPGSKHHTTDQCVPGGPLSVCTCVRVCMLTPNDDVLN